MRIAPFVLALAAAPAFAGAFTGTVEMSIANDKNPGGGTHKLTIGDGGMVSDLNVQGPAGPVQMKTLIKKSTPDKAYLINDAQKSYAEVQIPPPPPPDDETWTVKKLGNEKIAGYDAVHVTAMSSKGKALELWAAKDIMDAGEFAKAQGGQKIPSALVKALKDNGADGFFAKMVQKGPDGSTTTMQVTKVTKASIPASTFEIPSGYAKKDMAAAMPLPPDVQKKLDEKMKSMTPEQRAAMEKAMQGGAMPPPGH